MSPADELLVERWTNSSDADAFGEIVARHARMVYATSLRITRNHADAEDVAQECFLALAKGTNTIKFSLPGWLHRLATRRSLDVLRSVKRRRAHENVPTKSTSKPGSAETSWSDIQAYVDEAIAALPEKLRDPVVAHFLEGQSYQAVGEALGLHRSTVAHRVQRALELIRRVLKRRGVRVTSTSLAALFVANGSGAVVPSSLTAALGKIAIAGGGSAPLVVAAPSIGGSLVMKVAALAIGAAVLAIGTWTVKGFFLDGGASPQETIGAMPNESPQGEARVQRSAYPFTDTFGKFSLAVK